MNQGKRYLRNTVYTLFGLLVCYVGMNQLYASTVDAGTAPWLRRTLSLGLVAVAEREPATQLKLADLAQLRDFTRLSVSGELTVEIVGAPQYSVTMSGGADISQLRSWQNEGLLRLVWVGYPPAADAVLRIETPALSRVDAQVLRQLTLRGITAGELSVYLRDVKSVSLQQNSVARWKLYSSMPLVIPMDKTTLGAGSVQTLGDVAIRYTE
jgi:hypothetical protein